MHALNKEHRGVDKTTDVLSFPMYNSMKELPKDGQFLLGDIVINTDWIYSEIDRDAPAAAITAQIQNHTRRLLVHALLHLLGYDHEIDDRHEAAMKRKESQLIDALKKMD